jgi:hypothetical protein
LWLKRNGKMDFTLILILLFVLCWIILYRSRIERYYGIFYILRSNYGIRVIDSLARIKPGLWKFMADMSVLISFGGLGAYYLSGTRETHNNLRKSILLLGLAAAGLGLFMGYKPVLVFASLAAVVLVVWGLGRVHSDVLDFIASSSFISVIALIFTGKMFFSILMGVFGLPALLVYALVSHGMTILYGETALPGVSPLVPTSRGGRVGVFFPGYNIFIPWWYALIAVVVTLVSHEFAHGVLTRVCGVELQSTGLLTVGSLPIGAFVEPDEESLNKHPSLDRMRVYTMGSFANFVVGLLAAGVVLSSMMFLSGYVESNGMRIVGFIDGFPAKDVLVEDSIIYSINRIPTPNLDGFQNATAHLQAGEKVVLNTSAGLFSLALGESSDKPGRGYMGVYVIEDLFFKGAFGFLDMTSVSFFIQMLEWIIFFNINIGLVNLLPILPFDGGRMFKEIVESFNLTELSVKRVLYTIIVFTTVVFVVNTIPLFQMMIDYSYRLLDLV